MKLNKLKILWINDFSIKEVPFGGAEMTDDFILSVAGKNELWVMFKKASLVTIGDIEKFDLIILSNNYELNPYLRTKIIDNKKYICLCQDYGRWKSVLKFNNDLFNRSLLSIFMSVGHRDLFKFNITKSNTICLPPHIPEMFKNTNGKREDRIMYAGYMHEAKGIWNVLQYAEQNTSKIIDLYCYGENIELIKAISNLPNCNLKDPVLYTKMPEIYNKYNYLISLPNVYESFSKVVAEALLCGCELINNNKIGVLSYNWSKKELRKATLNSHKEFWKRVEECL